MAEEIVVEEEEVTIEPSADWTIEQWDEWADNLPDSKVKSDYFDKKSKGENFEYSSMDSGSITVEFESTKEDIRDVEQVIITPKAGLKELPKLDEELEIDAEVQEEKIDEEAKILTDKELEEETNELINVGIADHNWMLHDADILDSNGNVISVDEDVNDNYWTSGVDLLPILEMQYPGYVFATYGTTGNRISITASNGESIDLFPSFKVPETKKEIEDAKRRLGTFINEHGIDKDSQKVTTKKIIGIGDELYSKEEKDGGLVINKSDLNELDRYYTPILMNQWENLAQTGHIGWKESDSYILHEKAKKRAAQLTKIYKDAGANLSPQEIQAEANKQVLDDARSRAIRDKESDILNNYLTNHTELSKSILSLYKTKIHDKEFKEIAIKQSVSEASLNSIEESKSANIIKRFENIYNSVDKNFKYSEGDVLLKLENGKIVNEKTFNELLSAQSQVNSDYESWQKEHNSTLDQISKSKLDDAAQWDLLSRDYSILNKTIANICRYRYWNCYTWL